jgi:hypothetical protein
VCWETVKIVFVISALNGLHVIAADTGNAYLNAFTTDKVYVKLGSRFDEEANHVALFVHALYGL